MGRYVFSYRYPKSKTPLSHIVLSFRVLLTTRSYVKAKTAALYRSELYLQDTCRRSSKQAFLLLNGQTSSAYKHLLPTYNSISFLQLELNSALKQSDIRPYPPKTTQPHPCASLRTSQTNKTDLSADTSTIDQQNGRQDTNEGRPSDRTKDTESSHTL